MAKARVKVPASVKKGEVFEIKALVKHKMETGQRKDRKTGQKIPRDIINKFQVTYGGKEVFSSDWNPAVAANPYIAFFLRAEASGDIKFKWTDDKGKTTEETAKLTIS
ncbi:MAG: thiosulfate oxidation carrier complex protein SoxZ [Rhodospirillaceae bacterium]